MAFTKVRIVCISDTHNASPGEGYALPKGDLLIHAGDLTNQGTYRELKKSIEWISKADYPRKVVIAGNHDLSLDSNYTLKHQTGWRVNSEDVDECKELFQSNPGVVYLNHSKATITLPHKGCSIRIFGSPYSPDRGKQNWAFQYDSSEASTVWKDIPDDIDILVTHTPPNSFCDASTHWVEGGCAGLKAAIAQVRPRLHVCGHCHEGRGAVVVDWDDDEKFTTWSDPGEGNKKQSLLSLVSMAADGKSLDLSSRGTTAVVNASIMATSYGRGAKRFNKPIVVDLLLPIEDDVRE